MDHIYQRLTAIFRDIFEDESINLTSDLTAQGVPGWDSLSHIRLILQIQKEFGIRFSAAQTTSLKNVGELAELIRTKSEAAA